MTLGLDGALLVAITASAAIWAKRGEVVEDRLVKIVELVTGNPDLAATVASDVSKSMSTPSMLLRGVDASRRGQPRLPHTAPNSAQQPQGSLSLSKGRQAVRRGGTPELVAILEWFEGAQQWETAAIFFQQAARHLQLVPPDGDARKTSPVPMWSASGVSPGDVTSRHNNSYKTHNNEFRVAVSVLFRIFSDSARSHQSIALVASTCLLPTDEDDVLQLLQSLPRRDAAAVQLMYDVLSLPRYRHYLELDAVRSLLLTAACCDTADGVPTSWSVAWHVFERINEETSYGQAYAIRNVFYLIYTAACQANKQEEAASILREAHRREPEVLVEILLHNCRHVPVGVEMAKLYIEGSPMNSNAGSALALRKVTTSPSSIDGRWLVGMQLFQREISVRNANSVLSLLPQQGRSLAQVVSGVIHEVNQRVLLNATEATATAELSHLLTTVSSMSCWDAALRLATSPSLLVGGAQHGSSRPQQRAQMRSLAPLAIPLVRHRHWAGALHVLTMSLMHARGRLHCPASPHELTTCAYAAFKLEKTATGVFWYDRAHAVDRHVVQDSALQREAVHAAARTSWTSALKMLCSGDRHVITTTTDPKTAYELLRSADRDGATSEALNSLWDLGFTEWRS